MHSDIQISLHSKTKKILILKTKNFFAHKYAKFSYIEIVKCGYNYSLCTV